MIKQLPEDAGKAAILRAAEKRLPHVGRMRPGRVERLRAEYPDLLAGLEARPRREELSSAARARIRKIALDHPTLGNKELATLFRADRVLERYAWSEREVAYLLRARGRPLPGARARDQALAAVAKEIFNRNPKLSVDESLASLAERHPGVELKTLEKVARYDEGLAKALRRAVENQHAPARERSTAPSVMVSEAAARGLNLDGPTIAAALKRPGSPLVEEVAGRIASLEQRIGDNDHRLTPRDLARADPETQRVVERVYAKLGRKTLSLRQIQQGLPDAIASLVALQGSEPALRGLSQRAQTESVQAFADLYRERVVLGGETSSTFFHATGLGGQAWKRVQEALPNLFPKQADAPGERGRIVAIADLYRQLIHRELESHAFYYRAGIHPDELLILQKAHPDLFPRIEGTPKWLPIPRNFSTRANGILRQDLSRLWKEKVLSKAMSLPLFCRTYGVSKHLIAKLEKERPDEFPRPGHNGNSATTASEVGKWMTGLFEADVLLTREQALEAANRDAEFTARFGHIDGSRYGRLRALEKDAFPPFRDPKVIFPTLAKEVEALLRERPGLGRTEIASAMQARHPSFKVSRIAQLDAAYPALIPRLGAATVPEAIRRADAERLADEMARNPGRQVKDLAADLAREEPRFTEAYVYRLRQQFRRELFAKGSPGGRSIDETRASRPISELYALAAAIAPPGTSEARVAEGFSRLLLERGLQGYERPRSLSGLLRRTGKPGLEEQSAKVTSEVVAEYARAAPAGASEQEILEGVRRDYPTLNVRNLNIYRKMWKTHPVDYPAVTALVPGGRALTGRGERIARPRYIGGWDVNRALLGARPDELRQLARATQYARIPMHLPLLDRMVDDLGARKPLQHANLLWVSHLLGSVFPLARALQSAGLSAADTFVVGTPYGTNEAVRAAIADLGFNVRVPRLSTTAYRATVEAALDDAVARHRQNQQKIVVLDDGGLVTEILHSKAKYADVLDAFKIVEQTTRGITAAQEHQLRVPVVNVANSESKKAEGEFIGRSVAAKVLQGLVRLQGQLSGQPTAVIGYGVIGSAIADELRRAGAKVSVVETSTERAEQARRAGFHVLPKPRALAGARVVIGATGKRSLVFEDLRQLPSGAVVASASSKQVEIDMEALRRSARKRTELRIDSPLVHLPTASYQLGRSKLTVLGDGWPVNFDGDVEDLPADQIQITRAAMFAGALQAGTLSTKAEANRGILPLDKRVDGQILRRFHAHERGHAAGPIGDPDRWRDEIAKIAGAVLPPIR